MGALCLGGLSVVFAAMFLIYLSRLYSLLRGDTDQAGFLSSLDSVGDVFGSLFTVATGLLVLGSGVLPRWLGWVSILVGILFFVQGFGLGGVIATFGLVVDIIGFVLFLIFVLVSSVIELRRESTISKTAREIA